MAEVDDWQPVAQQQAAPVDDWQPVGGSPRSQMDDLANPSGSSVGIGEVPEAFLDRLRVGQAVNRVMARMAKDAQEGYGDASPTGLSDETLQQFIDLGIFHDPAKRRPNALQLANETAILPLAKLFDVSVRGLQAGLYGAGGLIGQLHEELGGEQGKAERARREVINFGNWAMIETGFGNFVRPYAGRANQMLRDQVVGNLPKDIDFKAGAAALDSPAAEANLRRAWEEDGIHPAEAVHDAATDTWTRHQLTEPITAYHGSPHDFEAFSLSKIGTGEGAQAYGHGLYFAEREGIGQHYLEALSGSTVEGRPFEMTNPVHRAAGMVDEFGSRGAAVKEARAAVERDPVDPFNKDVLRILEGDKPLPSIEQSGALYQVRIHADRERFLDWDKPLSEQPAALAAYKQLPEGVRDAIEGQLESRGISTDPRGMTGRDLHQALSAYMDQVAASQIFSEAGIPGIKFLDQQSRHVEADAGRGLTDVRKKIADVEADIARNRDNPSMLPAFFRQREAELADLRATEQRLTGSIEGRTRNFVVFDDSAIEITHKNGVPFFDQRFQAAADAKVDDILSGRAEGEIPMRAAGADVTRDPPLVSPADMPLPRPASLMTAAREAAAKVMDMGEDLKRLVAPMAMGPAAARAIAKDFANAIRRNRWEWARYDEDIAKQFTPEQRERMWNAADEESVAIQLGESREHQGLVTLEPAERAAVEDLQARAQLAWARARDLGMVEGEGLPAYTPRMIINAASSNEAALPLNVIGRNLRTTTRNLLRRAHLMAEETEAAAKAALGEGAELARDIRALPLATAHLEDAIAGRTLINAIKDYGARTGAETVAEAGVPAGTAGKWFTLDHPAFKTWKPDLVENPVTGRWEVRTDDAGNIIFKQVPLYVHPDFEGPLRAVLTQRSGPIYGAMMALKGKTMGLIMNSPMIHNAVEWGRALPAMPGKVVTFKVYFEGNRAKNNPAIMTEAIDAGLVPIGKRFFNQDITSIMEQPNLQPGRSWTAQVLGFVPGLFDPAAGAAVKRAIDKAGDFWHNTLLWDRIGDLQMGLYTNLRDEAIAKGIDRQTASRLAAHWANRYAGALPQEAMSDAARKISNMLLFSRSFTMGNLGVMKDMLTGLPKDVLAQIERDAGVVDPAAVGYAKSLARRKAITVVALDVGLMYVGNSLLQSALNVLRDDKDLDQEMRGYADRMSAAIQERREHPLKLLQPFDFLHQVSSTSENEPGKQDRIMIGRSGDGTAIYARNPAGKIGEEFMGYLTGPLDMIRRKLGTIARPGWQVLANDKGFGRKVYDPDADTAPKYLRNVGLIAGHFFASQLPEGQINAAADLVKGEGDPRVAAGGAFGPIAGITFSKGAPGGPAVGELYHARAQHQYAVDAALPDIRRQIIRGDLQGAQQRMTELGVPPGLQRFYVRTSLYPETRLSGKALRDFYLYGTEEQKARMERARGVR